MSKEILVEQCIFLIKRLDSITSILILITGVVVVKINIHSHF